VAYFLNHSADTVVHLGANHGPHRTLLAIVELRTESVLMISGVVEGNRRGIDDRWPDLISVAFILLF
jgi:hypothetical protein